VFGASSFPFSKGGYMGVFKTPYIPPLGGSV
jgi:hypothetical protein